MKKKQWKWMDTTLLNNYSADYFDWLVYFRRQKLLPTTAFCMAEYRLAVSY